MSDELMADLAAHAAAGCYGDDVEAVTGMDPMMLQALHGDDGVTERAAMKAEQEGEEEGEEEEQTYISQILLQNFDATPDCDFVYCRYYCGHMTRRGPEFIEFEIKAQEGGLVKYTNNSTGLDKKIKRAWCLSPVALRTFKRKLLESYILDCNDENWPEPNREGRQELEVVIGGTHISFVTAMCITSQSAKDSSDPQGLTQFVNLAQDLRQLVADLFRMHFMHPAVTQ